MARLPKEPEAFAEQVLRLLQRMRPDLDADLVAPSELVVDGRRLDLDNLMRLVATDRERGVEIVEQYLDHLFDEETFAAAAMSWESAKPRIMPRVQPESIFNHLSREQVAYMPWVNDTVVVFVIDLPNMTVSVTTDQLVRWNIGGAELELIARENLDRYCEELEFRTLESEEGGRAVLLTHQDGYDASRLLMPALYRTLAPRLGGDFLVATPSRDMFLAMSREPDAFVERVVDRVSADYKRLPYPITDRLFYVCLDGVAGTEPRSQAA